LGKMVLKVFHRILEDNRTVEENAGGLQKGQIRWDTFEKLMIIIFSSAMVFNRFLGYEENRLFCLSDSWIIGSL